MTIWLDDKLLKDYDYTINLFKEPTASSCPGLKKLLLVLREDLYVYPETSDLLRLHLVLQSRRSRNGEQNPLPDRNKSYMTVTVLTGTGMLGLDLANFVENGTCFQDFPRRHGSLATTSRIYLEQCAQ
jgi:hypothetical protein